MKVGGFLAFVFPLILIAQDNYEFGPNIIVNDDAPGTHWQSTTQRAIACRGETVYLVWGDNRYGNSSYQNHRIFFAKSTDAGNTWSTNLLISQNIDNYPCSRPHIDLDAFGNIYVVYLGTDGNENNSEVYLVKSTDGGTSFAEPVVVNDSTEVHLQWYPALAVDSAGQNVYVVWEDARDPEHGIDIYLACSNDGGASFLPGVRVNDDDLASQWYPVVVCDKTGQNVYVAWMDGRDTLHGWDVYFTHSTDYGQTFDANYPINDTATTGSTTQGYPSIYYSNGIIYAAWSDHCNGYCLSFAKSTDNGVSFGEQVLVPDDPEAHGAHPSIAADDSARVYIVWDDGRDFLNHGYEVYFAFSSDSGQSFHPNVLVNDHLGIADAWDDNSSICVNEAGNIFVAWRSDRNSPSHMKPDVYFARGTYVGIEEHHSVQPVLVSVRCYPNPFAQTTQIRYGAPEGVDSRQKSVVSINIYDMTGRLVKSFSPVPYAPGSMQISWHGDDAFGHKVPAGVYFVELVSNNAKHTHKLVKLAR